MKAKVGIGICGCCEVGNAGRISLATEGKVWVGRAWLLIGIGSKASVGSITGVGVMTGAGFTCKLLAEERMFAFNGKLFTCWA